MAEEKGDLGEDGEGGGKGKLFIIIGAVALLLIGGGAAFFLMGGDEPPPEGASAEQMAKTADAEDEDEEDEEDPNAEAIYYEMKPQFVIMLPPGSKFRQAQIDVQVFTHSPELVEYLKKNDPMIRHHLLNLLGAQQGNVILEREGREALQTAVKEKLVELIKKSHDKADRKLGKKLEAIYFTSFVLQ